MRKYRQTLSWLLIVYASVILCASCSMSVRNSATRIADITFAADSTCHSYHTLQIFRNGAVAYQAHHRILIGDGRATEKVLNKRFYKLSRDGLLRMFDIVDKFPLKPVQGLSEDIDEHPFQPSHVSSRDEMLMVQLRQFFDEVLNVRWYSIPTDSVPCIVEKYRPISSIQVSTISRKLIERK